MPETATNDVMSTLKDATGEQHTRAERHPMQASLVRGQLPVDAYCGYLEQLRHVHATLETQLMDAVIRDSRVAKVVRESQFRVEAIEADLAHFDCSGVDRTMNEATAALCEEITRTSETNPVALLGYHYVLEGSTNGGRFIAKALCGAYRLTPGGDGTRYLDPYGENHGAEWGAFRENMGAIELGDDDVASMVATASAMFDGITSIMDALTGAAEQQA